MSYKISFNKEMGIVFCKNEGELKYDDLLKESKEAIELLVTENAMHILVDFSNTEVQAKIIEIFDFPKIYEQLGMSRLCRIAIVVSEKELNTRELKFYDNVSNNSGWTTRVFLDEKPALEWLSINR